MFEQRLTVRTRPSNAATCPVKQAIDLIGITAPVAHCTNKRAAANRSDAGETSPGKVHSSQQRTVRMIPGAAVPRNKLIASEHLPHLVNAAISSR